MKIYGNLRGISLMSLLTTQALVTAHCMAPPDIGDTANLGSDDLDLGGGSGGSIHDSPIDGIVGHQLDASNTSGDDGDNDTMTKDAGGADDSGGHQLDSAQTDQGDLGLDPDNVGRDVS